MTNAAADFQADLTTSPCHFRIRVSQCCNAVFLNLLRYLHRVAWYLPERSIELTNPGIDVLFYSRSAGNHHAWRRTETADRSNLLDGRRRFFLWLDCSFVFVEEAGQAEFC